MKACFPLAAALLLMASPALRAADGSLSFSAASQQYVEVPNFQTLGITNEVTVEFWAYANAAAQQSAFMLSPDDGNNRFQAHISYFNGNTYWDFGDGGNGGRLQTTTDASWTGRWTHYAFVASQSGGFMKIYVDGVEKATVATMNPFETVNTYALRIGGSTGYFFNGKLDEFRVWNVALPAELIQTRRGLNLTGSEPGLRLYFKFDDGSGTTAVNSATATGSTYNGTLVNGPTWSAPARTPYLVVNGSDHDAGSLRAAVAAAAADPGPALITFNPPLDGYTITLTTAIAVDDDTGLVTIDASNLPAGVKLDGGGGTGNHGIFVIGWASQHSKTDFSLSGLTLKGAKTGAINVEDGRKLALTHCTLYGNRATEGGAIFSAGVTALTHCTLYGNTATEGGRFSTSRRSVPPLAARQR